MTVSFCIFGLLLKTLLIYAESGKQCKFDYDIIVNSTTISLFPSGAEDYCYRVEASIRIDETTDVTHEQLHNAFGRLENIEGILEVVNTAFTNLSFLSSLFFMHSVNEIGFGYDLIIMNNSKLETMAGGALLISGAIYVRIENNPLLDPNCTHVLAYYGHNRIIRGNRLNCGCELDGIALTNITIDAVEDNCAAIFGALYIFGPYTPSPETLTRKFGNASVVYGEIAIVDTDFEDLLFLRNVEIVDIPYSRIGTNNLERFIRIEKNGRLQRLGWHKLKRVISASIQIAANPNLCVTIPELEGILEPWTVYRAEAKVCDETQPYDSIEHVCRVGDSASLATIPGNCRTLVGRLTIDHSSSDKDLWKLYNVTRIFGTLTIRNSSLLGFSSLWKLREIANIAGFCSNRLPE